MSETFTAAAAFDVFKKRSQTGVLTRAALGYWLGAVILIAGFADLAWTKLGALFAAYGHVMQSAMASAGGTNAPADESAAMEILQAYGAIAPLYLLVILLFYVLFAAFEAAVQRWLVRGESGGGFLGLTLGADTWRVFACYLMWLVMFIAVYLAVVVVGGVLIAALFFGLSSFLTQTQIGIASGVVAVAAFAMFCLILVRFAPAAALSVGRGRFAFFEAWHATRGRVWSMIGAFALIMVIYTIFTVLDICVIIALLGPHLASMSNPFFFVSLTTLAAFALGYGVLLVAATIFLMMMLGVNSALARVAIEEAPAA